MKRALITGVSGMDGSHLADLLLEKGYEVHGLVRRPLTEPLENLEHIRDKIGLHQGDICDHGLIVRLIRNLRPDEIYNLAGVTFVPASWDQPSVTAAIVGTAVAGILDAILQEGPHIKFYQASSSEMFGNAPAPQNEDTPMKPVSPYGNAKLYAHGIVSTYRQRYGLFACSGICFNHEGPRRGRHFVTRKVCEAASQISQGRQKSLKLGWLSARRDWGYAPDYVRAMWMMLQAPSPADYVVATGVSHSVRDLVEAAFKVVGLQWQMYVEQDDALARPNEISELRGDAAKIRDALGWKPEMSFEDMVREMVIA